MKIQVLEKCLLTQLMQLKQSLVEVTASNAMLTKDVVIGEIQLEIQEIQEMLLELHHLEATKPIIKSLIHGHHEKGN